MDALVLANVLPHPAQRQTSVMLQKIFASTKKIFWKISVNPQ